MKEKIVTKKEKTRDRLLTIKKKDSLFVTVAGTGKKVELKVVDNKVKLIK